MGNIILFGEPEVNVKVKETVTVPQQPANPPVLKMLGHKWITKANLTGGNNGSVDDLN
jgi:hypothetical protein